MALPFIYKFTFSDSGFLILTNRSFAALLLISLEFKFGELEHFYIFKNQHSQLFFFPLKKITK